MNQPSSFFSLAAELHHNALKGLHNEDFAVLVNSVVQESIHTPPQKVIGNSLRGGGVLKVKLLEEKYEAKQEFPGGGGRGCKTKNLLWGHYECFLELHILWKTI